MPIWALIALQIAASLLIAALQPKPKTPNTKTAERPTIEEGRKHVKVYGTVWLDTLQALAWKQVGTIKIKSKGKK